MTIYLKIKELVNKTEKLSISGLEKELGFGSGTIRRWQTNDPGLEKVIKVANYFEIPVTDLITQDTKQNKKTFASQIETKIKDIPETEKENLISETMDFLNYKIKLLNKKTTEEN